MLVISVIFNDENQQPNREQGLDLHCHLRLYFNHGDSACRFHFSCGAQCKPPWMYVWLQLRGLCGCRSDACSEVLHSYCVYKSPSAE